MSFEDSRVLTYGGADAIAPTPPSAQPKPNTGSLRTPKRQAAAWARKRCVDEVRHLRSRGVTMDSACEDVSRRLGSDPTIRDALPGKKCAPDSIKRWFYDAEKRGEVAFEDRFKGRGANQYEWELAARRAYQRPGVCYTSVAKKLRREGYKDATDDRVRAVLKRLPSYEAETAPKRIGAAYRKANHSRYKIMDWSGVPVGGVYEGDGHRMKVYVEHPSGHGYCRPELTVWMDRRSRRIVGFWMSAAESAESTKYSLVTAFEAHQHTPAYLHIDPGPGFKNQAMLDTATGLCPLLGIEVITAIPGNAKGKGAVERWFKRLIRDWAVFWDTAMYKRTDDFLSRFQTKLDRGEIRLPTFENFFASFCRYVDQYNSEPLPVLDKISPDAFWDMHFSERREPTLEVAQMLRRREKRAVRNSRVWVNKHPYGADFLRGFELRTVVVEIDGRDPMKLAIYTLEYRYLGEASLEPSHRALPESFDDIANAKRLQDQIKRLDRKKQNAELQAQQTTLICPATLMQHGAESELCAPDVTPDADLLKQGHSLTRPTKAEPVSRATRPVNPQTVDRLRAELESDADEQDETPAQRFARALELEAADDISEADARWLAIYQTSPEYHSRLALHEEFGVHDDPQQEDYQ